MQIYFIISLIASIVLIIFAITNATPVPVSILFAKYELSLALIIVLSTACGAIIATLIGLPKQFKQTRLIKKLTNENENLIKEKEKLQDKELVKDISPDEEDPLLNGDKTSQ